MPGPSAAQDRPSTEPNATVQPLQVVRTLQLGQQARLPASSIRAGEAVHQYIALRLPIAERQAALMLQHPRSCPPTPGINIPASGHAKSGALGIKSSHCPLQNRPLG